MYTKELYLGDVSKSQAIEHLYDQLLRLLDSNTKPIHSEERNESLKGDEELCDNAAR